MKRRYPVKTIIFIAVLTSIDYSSHLNYRLTDSSQSCHLRGDFGKSTLDVVSTSRFDGHSRSDRLISEKYTWFAVSSAGQGSVVLDFKSMVWTGELVEVTRSLPERLVGQQAGYYRVFNSPEGSVLIMDDMLQCSG